MIYGSLLTNYKPVMAADILPAAINYLTMMSLVVAILPLPVIST